MMFHIYIEIPSGAKSRGYYYEDRDMALKAFQKIHSQLQTWSGFEATIWMQSDGLLEGTEIANA